MSGTLTFLILFPSIWAIIAFFIWRKQLPWTFIPALMLSSILITTLIYNSGKWSKTSDYEVWNGQVTGKQKEKVSCSHSYSCHCRTECSGSGKNRSCSQVCDTCYDHSYDIDWDVLTTLGKYSINRVDRQGLDEPPRWSIIVPGQPWATVHSFTNYIKAAPFSLFGKTEKELQEANTQVPQYPLHLYDYQYIDRVLINGVTIPDINQWNYDLAMILRDLGPTKQANVVIIFTNKDSEYTHVVHDAWIGGKKNDIIVLVGMKQYPTIEWINILSWTKEELFKVQLRDDLQELGTVIDRNKFLSIIHDDTAKMFNRRHMSEFKYLEDTIEPSDTIKNIAMVLSILGSFAFTFIFLKVRKNIRSVF